MIINRTKKGYCCDCGAKLATYLKVLPPDGVIFTVRRTQNFIELCTNQNCFRSCDMEKVPSWIRYDGVIPVAPVVDEEVQM